MPKVAIITANVGNVDAMIGIPKQSAGVDFFYYHEHNLPFPLVNISNRMKARYLKAQSHRFLPDHDLHIWIDHRIAITGTNFVENFIEQSKDHDLAIYRHYERQNVYQELEYIGDQMRKGSKYLLARYARQPIVREALLYKDCGLPDDFPLFIGGVFARWNNKKVNACFDEWWRRIMEFSYSDQTMLSLVAWQHKLKINELAWDTMRTHKLFTIGKHQNPDV